MAPLLASSPWDYLPSLWNNGDLIRHAVGSSVEPTKTFTPHQQYIAQVLALIASSTSIMASLITSYWFLKMKRNFRHHLVMLLIQSNVFKALWLFIGPIVALTNGPLQSGSAYCNVSGFFYAVGAEASDWAVLMIAIHTALYILQTTKATGNGGLYPYRKYAYAVWLIFPLVMASLAFINPNKAYISQATHCYLRIRPYWYRIALSWAPRYIIFFTIIVVYGSIYAYVKLQFRGFHGEFNRAQNNHDAWLSHGKSQQSGAYDPRRRNPLRGPPSTPKLISHGLLSSSEDLSTETPSSQERSDSSASTQNINANTDHTIRLPATAIARAKPSWEALTFNTYPASLMPIDEDTPSSTTPTDSTDSTTTTTPDSTSTRNAPPHNLNILQALHAPRSSPRHRTTPTHPRPEPLTLNSFLSSGSDFNAVQLRKRRAATQRQVTVLFLYPLVYTVMWIVPFIAHCRSYSDAYAARPSFALSVASTLTLALQAAVDCLVFVAREKPWQHIPGSRRTFVDSFRFWEHRRGHRRDPLSRAAAAVAAADSSGEALGPESDVVLERRIRLGLRRAGDPEAEMALQARGRFLRSESDRRRRLVFVRGKLGKGREKSWWEVEGAWRNDSGFLGEGGAAVRRGRGEAGEEEEEDEDMDDVRGV